MVGTAVGVEVGAAVGLAVGAAVGLDVGAAEALGVGEAAIGAGLTLPGEGAEPPPPPHAASNPTHVRADERTANPTRRKLQNVMNPT
jgi:hypothetical protein